MSLYGIGMSSKFLDQDVSNFLFQILLDLKLKFKDLVYTFLMFTFRNLQSGTFFHNTSIDIIHNFEDFNTQSMIAASINVFVKDSNL